MSNKIINVEQSEYWNEKSGPKWVRIDDSMNERFSGLTDELFHRSKIVQNDRVLDVGCGGGETSFRASRSVGSSGYVLGADISETLLTFARNKFSHIENLEFNTCDAQNYKFKVGSFDKVISRFGMMFFENPIEAFKNIHLSMKRGGSLDFVCWADMKDNEFFIEGSEIVTRYTNKDLPPTTREPGAFAFSDKKYIREILDLSGFREIKIDTVVSSISTRDTPEKDAEMLLSIGPRAKLYSGSNLSDGKMSAIKNEVLELCKKRQVNHEIKYNAPLHFVKATK
tara:strand:+ start:520 stop:1368 length:849 start_codon:yes stop_codon:yes gene_type:complete